MNGLDDRTRRVEALQPAGLEVALRLEGALELAEALRAAMPGWPLDRVPVSSSLPQTPSCEALTAWRSDDGYGQGVPTRSGSSMIWRRPG